MEDGLVRCNQDGIDSIHISLNPCCDGRWSRTPTDFKLVFHNDVLILVVMEDGLVLSLFLY